MKLANIYLHTCGGRIQMSYCINCGNEIPQNANFCPNCGYKLHKYTPKRISGSSVASFTTGLISLILIMTGIGTFVAPIGLITGIISVIRDDSKIFGIAGIVLSAIVIIITAVFFVVGALA